LEVLEDLPGVHAARADSVLAGERLSKDYVRYQPVRPYTMAMVRGRGVLLTIWSLESSI
jgi:hypothetical protein